MSKAVLPSALWAAAVLLIAGAIRVNSTSIRVRPADDSVITADGAASLPAEGTRAWPNRDLLREQAATLRDHNPFRLERTPTDIGYGDWEPTDPTPVLMDAPDVYSPVLSIGGIVGGPPWKAVIEGIAGHESGVLLEVGEEWNGVRIDWIRSDSVRLSTPDTAWVLALKQLWR